jgi:DNA-binding PadR family transcriptional regulator
MPIHHALLSLLARGESYGYELKGSFERSVGPQWGALNIGHVYQLLDRLRRDGWVEVVRAEPQARRPDRMIYAITPPGRDELERWLRTPAPPATGYRDELYLKLVAAARAQQLGAVIEMERGSLLAELHSLRSLPDSDELAALLKQGAALHVEARLRLLELAGDGVAAIERAAAADADARETARPARRAAAG